MFSTCFVAIKGNYKGQYLWNMADDFMTNFFKKNGFMADDFMTNFFLKKWVHKITAYIYRRNLGIL